MSQVTVAECKSFYTLQAFIETVHSETYSKILEVLIHDEEKRRTLANAVHFKKPIKNKAKWAEKYEPRYTIQTTVMGILYIRRSIVFR